MIFWINFLFGVCFVATVLLFSKKRARKKLEKRAQLLLQDAADKINAVKEDREMKVKEYKEDSLQKLNEELRPTKEEIEELKIKIEETQKEQQQILQIENSKYQKKENQTVQSENYFKKKKKRFTEKQENLENIKNQYIKALEGQIQTPARDIKEKRVQELYEEFKNFIIKKQKKQNDIFELNLEKKTKDTIHHVIHRFIVPYCPERGIPNIEFKNLKAMKKVLGPKNEHLTVMENLMGVDLTPSEEKLLLSVSAFDCVRRELTRLVCLQLMKDKRVNMSRVKAIVSRQKKQLFQKIQLDGQFMLKKLKLKNVHPEIIKFMGSLRYRYSFTQNQYFHCGEVGTLCGLLSEELMLNKYDGRRAGWLHDLGKSMDHSLPGGHAVIGADFIAQHGEKEPIVHAVRAHHYDTPPKTPLAFLVIGADAISGARPGARRFTTESYTQKLEQLEQVTKDFEGVEYFHILNAGRELRVYVDSQKVNDLKALDLSQKLASKIEDEMQYPGQIRVTVVRQTLCVHKSNEKVYQ